MVCYWYDILEIGSKIRNYTNRKDIIMETAEKKTKSGNLPSKIARELMQFSEGENKPVRLPSERKLAERFSVSRRQVRLAIERLEERGLIVRKHGSGNYLLPKKVQIEAVNIVIPENIKADDPFYNALIAQFFFYTHENNIRLIPVKLSDYMLLNPELPVVLLAEPEKGNLIKLTSLAHNSKIISLVDISAERAENLCCVFYDDNLVGEQAANIISEHNHRNVLFLTGIKTQYPSAIKRHKAFLVRAYELGLNVRICECKMNYAGGYEAMKEYLYYRRDMHKDSRATIIFASTDWMAAGAYQAIGREGLSIPEDFSIIGCDDVPLAGQLRPTLSTFKLDIENFVEQVFSLIEQSFRRDLPARVVLNPKFIKRESLIYL